VEKKNAHEVTLQDMEQDAEINTQVHQDLDALLN
jgi:hypothetical protein